MAHHGESSPTLFPLTFLYLYQETTLLGNMPAFFSVGVVAAGVFFVQPPSSMPYLTLLYSLLW